MIYNVIIRSQARKDIIKIIEYIDQELFNPVAAERFGSGIYTKINQLGSNAGIFAKSIYKDVLKYDDDARHVLYKGFTIIYSIHGDVVLVHRVIHGSLIKG